MALKTFMREGKLLSKPGAGIWLCEDCPCGTFPHSFECPGCIDITPHSYGSVVDSLSFSPPYSEGSENPAGNFTPCSDTLDPWVTPKALSKTGLGGGVPCGEYFGLYGCGPGNVPVPPPHCIPGQCMNTYIAIQLTYPTATMLGRLLILVSASICAGINGFSSRRCREYVGLFPLNWNCREQVTIQVNLFANYINGGQPPVEPEPGCMCRIDTDSFDVTFYPGPLL